MMGAQASDVQMEKDPVPPEDSGSRRRPVPDRRRTRPLAAICPKGYYIQPTLFKGHNDAHLPGRNLRPGAGCTTFSDRRSSGANDTV